VILLLSNDDGIDAPGLGALAKAAAKLGDVWVVAPDSERSACSHSLTMHRPLRLQDRGDQWFAVDGTPADCVYLALHQVLPEAPALVISGINRGANLGDDVLYSGTVAAAREGALHHLPALAVSLSVDSGGAEPHWETAGSLAMEVAAEILEQGLPQGVLLNLNVPDVPRGEVKGIVATHMGRRRYHPLAEKRVDPRGRPYFWIGGTHQKFCETPGSDGLTVRAGYASVTPLQPEMTARSTLESLSDWPSISRPTGT
jgi:5'-nucleotidase